MSMGLRIKAGRFFIGLSKFIECMPVLILKPKDLIRFSRAHYSRQRIIDSWGNEETRHAGLNQQELTILESLPPDAHDLLLLGVGGGREAIPLAQQGYRVTGVDFIEDMVRHTQEYGAGLGLDIGGMIGELSELKLETASFDVIWFSTSLYSMTPTRKRRLALLKKMQTALRPGGVLVLQCMINFTQRFRYPLEWLKRLIIILSLGNFGYEPGDKLWGNCEYIHQFPSEKALRDEVAAAGFRLVAADLPLDSLRGYLIMRAHEDVHE